MMPIALDFLAELLSSGKKKQPYISVRKKRKSLTSSSYAYNNSQELSWRILSLP